MNTELYQFLADIVLIAHFAIVLFVIVGLVLIILGNKLGWAWVNGVWFRAAHLATIIIVVAESWFGFTCPLTTLETWLRDKAGSTSYDESFIEHWVQRFLFFDAPTWIFVVAYTVFGLLVIGAWWCFPPKFKKAQKLTAKN